VLKSEESVSLGCIRNDDEANGKRETLDKPLDFGSAARRQ
jgi:hypothetical protein